MSTTRHTTLLQTRHVIATLAVVTAHAGLLWLLLLQTVQQDRLADELVIHAQVVMAQAQTPASLPEAPATPLPAAPPPLVKPAAQRQPSPVAAPPASQSAPAPALAPAPPTAPSTSPASPATAALPAPSGNPAPATRTPGTTPAATPAAPRIELPSSDADYLNNPKPPYPPSSKRLREEGKVIVHVLIEADGTASQAEISSSSGYHRLDRVALQTVLHWRYVPGKRNGVPEAMWFYVPINFVLE